MKEHYPFTCATDETAVAFSRADSFDCEKISRGDRAAWVRGIILLAQAESNAQVLAQLFLHSDAWDILVPGLPVTATHHAVTQAKFHRATMAVALQSSEVWAELDKAVAPVYARWLKTFEELKAKAKLTRKAADELEEEMEAERQRLAAELEERLAPQKENLAKLREEHFAREARIEGRV
jgi:signal transduction histidine kinase